VDDEYNKYAKEEKKEHIYACEPHCAHSLMDEDLMNGAIKVVDDNELPLE